ncbi:MAG: hypothetical protein J0I43_12870 [Microbacterium sp.]|nr:hypothetical protein [Microbacterium sp.]MBN9188541.1 hypothetical protein [Microbacterium sp.]
MTLDALILVVGVVAALTAALVLVTVSSRSVRTGPLAVAGALVVVCFVAVSVVPARIPALAGAVLALLTIALATVGGNPVARWVLRAADGGKTTEGPRGGILVELMAERSVAATVSGTHQEEILRGGTTIGYLERLAAALSLVAGFPAAIAVIVALKGIGRFTELATPAARERFIVGTLASLVWACAVGAIAPLALW